MKSFSRTKRKRTKNVVDFKSVVEDPKKKKKKASKKRQGALVKFFPTTLARVCCVCVFVGSIDIGEKNILLYSFLRSAANDQRWSIPSCEDATSSS